jgi:ribosomal protein L16 Arg81 hydroxylase
MLSYDHDLLVFDLIGRSGWELEDKFLAAPAAVPASPALTAANLKLNPGDLLYLPRGQRHACQLFDEATAILIVMFKNPTGVDLIGRLFDRLREADIARFDVPRFASEDIQANYLTELQAEILGISTQPGLLLGFMKDLWSISEPRRCLSLPWSVTGNVSLLPRDVELRAAVRFPHQDSLVYGGEDESFEVVHEYKKVRLGQTSAKIMECLLERRVLSLAALMASCGLPDEQLFASLSEIIKLGLVIVSEPAPPI